MNGKPILVFKMSRFQSKLAIVMDGDNPEAFLHGAYCFANSMFKKFPGFVPLSAFEYVFLVQKMVKLCTMELKFQYN